MGTLTIHKQAISPVGKTILEVPKGTFWLDIQIQLGVPVLWYKCDAETKEVEPLTIVGLMTGAKFHDSHKIEYISTCQTDDGGFVIHYFKVQEE